MQDHRWTRATEFDISASRGFEMLKAVPFSAPESEGLRDFRVPPAPLHDIPKMVFGGFARCLYPEQKFGSDPERRFAILLEDEPGDLKWFKPARDQLRIHYRGDQTYEPDFVVETATHKYLCEPKRASEMDAADVRAKARAAVEWCRHATDHELAHGGKPWSYRPDSPRRHRRRRNARGTRRPLHARCRTHGYESVRGGGRKLRS